MSKTPKTTGELMHYLSDKKGIAIAGTVQERKLMNIGYYHGYKGYRYIKRASKPIAYTDFAELLAVYEFDAELKVLFYPFVMQIETALKSYVLEIVACMASSDSFIDIYNSLLDNYKMFSVTGRVFASPKERKQAEDKFKEELKRRLELRDRINKVQTDAFGRENKIAEHYLSKGANLPIWAIFELLSLGEFGRFVSCLNLRCRKAISEKIGISQSDDTDAKMPQMLIFTTRDLRNAIAHNDVTFDTRFRTGKISKQLRSAISNATGVSNLTFSTITDYLALVVYQLSLLHMSEDDIPHLISSFVESTERLREKIPISVYNQIIYTDNNAKIEALIKMVDYQSKCNK